ncbi:MAG: cell division protein ZapA [Alphaproteobacteria bacterium]|nr:cell division protein ZapA [Alphaproteobacteria bacterium]MCB9974747.1 cell division protein ZapA [Rhodospirillales bacterium]
MSEVTVVIGGKGYSLSCDQGQEERLRDLSAYVDSRLTDIGKAGAANNEAHLLVLTALVLADEIFDLKAMLGEFEEENTDLSRRLRDIVNGDEAGPLMQEELFVAQALDHLSGKIDTIAERIEKARA